ncbi:MAG: DUF4838 domain-containing protein [Saprospiraceae bacterium]
MLKIIFMRNIIIILLGIFLMPACQNISIITLVKNGQSDYQIQIAANADSVVVNAATAFQKAIASSHQVKLPIIQTAKKTKQPVIKIQVDPSLASEATINYQTQGKDILLSGGNSQSTRNAVYEFLERELDYSYLAPDATILPSGTQLKVAATLVYQYTPEVLTRTVHSRLFYENPEFAAQRRVTQVSFPDYVPEARVHTFHRFLPGDEYYAAHPEYYALRNGKRLTTQLCLTNPDVLDLVIKKVGQLFEENPNYSIASVSQDDNTQHCQCDDCSRIDTQAESPAGTMIAFVNQVAKAFPDKTISTLAYQYTRKAPKGIQPEKNVLITLCSIECDRSAPIEENCLDFAQDLQEWGALTDNIRIWDYTTQFTNFLAPFPNLRTLQPNVQTFRNNNAKWIFEQHSNNPSELFELRSYLTAKLLWNPDLDFQKEMDRFLAAYYGAAGPFIGQYIQKVHDELAQDSSFFLFLYGDPSQGFNSFLSAENLSQYQSWYDQAEAAVADDSILLQRVQIARLSVDYAALEAARKNLSAQFSIRENLDWIQERLAVFEKTCANANITMMNEMRYSVEEYLAGYRATFERAQIKNLAEGRPVRLLTKPKKYAQEDPQTLTDGALGGANFYANWLGFEGNDLEAIIDLGQNQSVNNVSTAFLQVVNHIVFLPKSVSFYASQNGQDFELLGTIDNPKPLKKESKINDIQNFGLAGLNTNFRYLKIKADNMDTAPDWHHGAGLPSWIFVDEVIVE